MNEFLILLQAKLDEAKSKGLINSDIASLQSQLDKLKLQVELDPNTAQKLANDIEKLINQKITISNINIDTNQAIRNAQQTGQQIGDAVNKGVENSVKKATNALKSFSELKIGTGNIDAVVDKNGLLNVEKSLDRIKEKYSEFGQVKITDKLFDSEGNLQQFRVNIQQLNGDLKESRSFMMALASSGKSFGFPEDVIKGSESYVHHLNDAKKFTNEVLTEEEKLAKIMADVREKTEQTRQAEEKRQQLAQSNAINKSLEQEYLQRQKISEQLSSKANKIQFSIDTGGYETRVRSLIAQTQQWTDEFGNAKINTTALTTALDNLGKASTTLSNKNTLENQKALIAAEKELDAQIRMVTNSVKVMNSETMKSSAVDSLRQSYQEFYDKNSAAHRQWGKQLKQNMLELAEGAEVSKRRGEELKQELVQIQNAARQAGKLGKSGLQKLFEGFKSFGYWTSSTFIIMKLIQSIKSGIGTVKALDTALVDLKKTTTMTNSELEDFYYSSNKVAKQMGVTTEEIINQASAWSRLGYGSAEAATKMAKLSSQFALISPGMDVDKATSGLVSIMKAYDISVDDVLEKIESKVNIIGNNLALSNDNIVSMLQDSVSAMAEGRNTLEQTIALESAAYEIVQDNSVGNGFKTVSLRLRGLNEETQELDDSLKTIKGDLYDLTGVSIMEDANTYKSTYQILKEISGVWESLTDKTRAEALELMFGKLRSNVGAAVLKNFSAAERAMGLMADSAGSADRELEVVTQSIDYKLNRLSETSTSVAQNLFKRDDMKTVVDGLTSVMNVIDKLTSKLGLFGSIGLGTGLFAGVKNIGKTIRVYGLQITCFMF